MAKKKKAVPEEEVNPLDEINFDADPFDTPLDLEDIEDGFQPLPVGTYKATITGTETKTSQSGNPMLVVEYTVISEQGNGRKVWDNYVLSHPVGLSRLKTLVKIAAPDQLSSFRPKNASEYLVGKVVQLKLKQRKGNDGKVYNQVAQVLPLDDEMEALF